jgi:hypothetical protein
MFDWTIYRLFVLNRDWKLDSLQMMIFVYVCSTWSIVELKTRSETWITRNDVNGVNLFHIPFMLTLMIYLCSQWTPNVQMKYFMFDWSNWRLFVLNTAGKLDSFQIVIFVYVCSTWSIVELKTRFETWKTNDVNDISMFNLLNFKTLMAYLCSQRIQNVQIKSFNFDWSIYRLFVLHTAWKRTSLDMFAQHEAWFS